MKIPEYVSKSEVKKVCRELGLRDWSALKKPEVDAKEAAAILRVVNVSKMKVPLEDFRQGMEVELEHGTMYPDANVTNNHPLLTGMIVLAHLKESMDYYRRLEVVEIEGDILKALLAGDLKKVAAKYRKLAIAQLDLDKAVAAQVK